jgi:hypothetical protein
MVDTQMQLTMWTTDSNLEKKTSILNCSLYYGIILNFGVI